MTPSARANAQNRPLAGRGAALLACTVLLVTWMRTASSAPAASLDQLKVAYALHFFELIEWEQEGSSLDFCAYSTSAVGDNMVSTFRGRKIRNMQITTRRIERDDPNIARCKVIFIPDSSAGDVPVLLKRLKSAQAVTISSIPDFVDAGGLIGFVVAGDRLRFDINKEVAERNKLKVSARLLELARKVVP